MRFDFLVRANRRSWLAVSCVLVANAAVQGLVAADEKPPALVPTTYLTAPEGFEVTVWAQSPQLRNPTNMDIDAAGRIWVAEGVNYRRHAGRDPKGDRIVVLEDTDGDGRADTSSVFVQEPLLVAPLGIAVIDNQIIVSNAPDLIVYTDVDRDRRFNPAVDKREVLLTGFNGRNHDHALHSVTFGPDGWWYLNQGNAGALVTDRSGRTFRVGSIYDPVPGGGAEPIFGWRPIDFAGARSDDGHVYVGGFAMRVRPDGTNLQVIGFNFRNSYEQVVTSSGDVFQNDNDDPPASRTTFLMEYGNLGFFSRDGRRTWNADRRPGQTIPVAEWRQEDPGTIPAGDVYGAGAPTGIAFNEGDGLGADWRGVLLSCEAARNTVFGYRPQPDGAGFKLERFNFLTSNQEGVLAGIDSKSRPSAELKTFFRPSDVVIGPDGAVYVADWFDARVGGHQDFDEGTTGAIYRVAPKGFRSVVPAFDLATVAGQIAALKSPAVNVRALGFMRLHEAGAAAVAPVAALLGDQDPNVRARAVWLLAQLGPEGVTRVERLLADPDARLRITAFRALRRINHRVLQHAAALARDDSPAVRREVALALRDVPWSECGEILQTLASGFDGVDRSYLEAWGIGCTGKEAEMYAALAAGQTKKNAADWPAGYARLVWRLTPAAAVPQLAARATATNLSEADRLAAVTALGFISNREAPLALLDLAQRADGLLQRHAVWWLINNRNTLWREHALDAELKARGIYDADAIVVAPSVVPVPEPTKLPSAAEIARLEGDVTRGADKAQSCLLCHRLGDRGIEYAPSLAGLAGRQSTEATITAIIDPSADIAQGFGGREVVLNDGTIVHGLVETEGDPLIIRSMGGLTQMIPANRVKELRWFRRSLMLSAEQLSFSAQDVADIVAYLKTQ